MLRAHSLETEVELVLFFGRVGSLFEEEQEHEGDDVGDTEEDEHRVPAELGVDDKTHKRACK